MRYTPAFVVALALAVPGLPALAGPPKSKPATAGPKAPKASVKASPKPVTGPKVHGSTALAARPPKTPKAPATSAAAAATKTRPTHAGGPKSQTATATTPIATVAPPPAMPKNPKLVARLQGMLPAGMTVEQAALGFRNQGQFIAAVQVSNSLGIPFADLKTSMVTDGLSLGRSIQQWKPTLDGEVEAARAQRWANQQLEPR